MPNRPVLGQNMFGTQSSVSSGGSTFPWWRYILIMIVVSLGCLYAAPNLYPPDYALQIQTDNADLRLGTRTGVQLQEYLESEGVDIKQVQAVGESLEVRLRSNTDQIRAKSLLENRLNPIGQPRQFVIALNLAPTTPMWLQDIGATPMTLGLDLAGGIHFVLQVNMESAIEKQLNDESDKVRTLLRDASIRYVNRDDYVEENAIDIGFLSEERRAQAMDALEDAYAPPNFELSEVTVEEYPGIRVTLTEDRLADIEDIAIEQNLSGLRKRVNELGVAEPLVQRLGSNRIVIDLPGIQDSSEAKRILDKFATLEFRLVAQPGDRPSQIEMLPYRGQEIRLRKENIVTGDNIINAIQSRDPETSTPQVNFTLDSTGGERLNRATAPNVGESMAIIFIEERPVVYTEEVDGELVQSTKIETDRRLISVATIQSALTYNSRITGLTVKDARELAILLRAGALAAPMYFVEERTVGASLGQENIDRGFLAVTIGFVLVLIFMLVYYKVFGFIANIALTLNLVILVAVMSVLGATLTLPGIAGIVLTVGMAVDANVLIFSRIREELKSSPPSLAIRNGYERAFLTILDANVTTLFVALILLAIGSGPVAGFAVTLSIGIVTSMFTAIFVSRGLVHLVYGRSTAKALHI